MCVALMTYSQLSLSMTSAVRHLAVVKLKFFKKPCITKTLVHHVAQFRVGIGHTVRYYNFRVFFLVKCKNSLDDYAQHGISFSQLEIVE